MLECFHFLGRGNSQVLYCDLIEMLYLILSFKIIPFQTITHIPREPFYYKNGLTYKSLGSYKHSPTDAMSG